MAENKKLEIEKNTNLGKYFDDNTLTVFDEIVQSSNSSTDFFNSSQSQVSGICELNELSPMSEINTTEFLNTNTIFTSERSTDISSDYHRDAWIPSENTRLILRTIATSTPGTCLPDRINLTMPGLTLQGDMVDTTKEASIHYLGDDENIHRNVLTSSDVTQDERGLRNLIQAGCYRAAVNLSGRLLAVYGQGYGKINYPSKHTPHSLQLWFTRLSLLAKLRQIDILKAESQSFDNLDKPDIYFIFYPELYGTRHGSMASFSFRLLLAEIPSYYGKYKDAIDNLYHILSITNKMIDNLNLNLTEDGNSTAKFTTNEKQDAIKLWSGRRSRILISIINCSLLTKNFILAIEVLDDLLNLSEWNNEQIDIIKSAIGRVHLFLGDVLSAEKKFTFKNDKHDTLNVRELIDRGLMAVAQNAFQEAFNCFKAASIIEPTNIMLINNMAVCLLYNGQLKTAVQLLETNVTRNPIKFLQEPVLLNMCTLYELHTTHCKQSKLHLLRQMNRYKGDATDISCLKLT